MEQAIKRNDVNQYFIDNVVNPILSGAYGRENVPLHSGQGRNVYNQIFYQNLAAVPQNDMKEAITLKLQTQNALPIHQEDKISGTVIYEATKSMLMRLSNVMKFDSHWYHQINGSMVHVSGRSGKAVMQDVLPDSSKSGYSGASNSARKGLSRSADRGTIFDPTARGRQTENSATNQTQFCNEIQAAQKNRLAGETMIKMDSIKAFFTDVRNIWQRWYDAAPIKYTLYTCHSNCHGNCHGSRGRR